MTERASFVRKVLPFVSWFDGYGGNEFKADATAGFTVALILIPQSMAYAQLAGLPAYYGLYASFLPPMIAALFGSSRRLSTGPAAVVSLMTAASLEPLATTGSGEYIAYAVLLSFCVGLFQFLLGVLRLGLIVNFLSHPVIIGFTNAAALIIASSQFSKFFGVTVEKAEHQYETVFNVIVSALQYTHVPTVVMGGGALLFMIVMKKVAPKFPYILLAVITATVVSHAVGFENNLTVDIADIRSDEAKKIVLKYGEAMESSSRLSRERTGKIKILKTLEYGSPQWIESRKDVDLLSYRLRIAKKNTEDDRKKIRGLLFCRVLKGEKKGWYLKKDLPEDAPFSDFIRRINVTSIHPDSRSLVMSGGGDVVGTVPGGLPDFGPPAISITLMLSLFPYAVIIAVLGFTEAISIAKSIATKTGRRVDPNQELMGQGLGNIIGSFAQSYPTSGSFGRSALNLNSGALTGMSSVITGITVIITLLFFTPLLYHLPQCVLAAVILLAVSSLFNIHGFVHAWKAHRRDGLIAVITFISTLYYAPHLDKGVMIGVLISLAIFLYKSMRPRVVSLSRGEDKRLHAALVHGLAECKYIDMIRFDGPLFFGNSGYLEDQVIDHMKKKPNLSHIIIEAGGISMLDASGEDALELIIERAKNKGVTVSFSDIHQNVLDVMTRTGMVKKIGVGRFYDNMEQALNAVYMDAHKNSPDLDDCPLKQVVYTE